MNKAACIVMAVCGAVILTSSSPSIEVTDLRTEMRTDPQGIAQMQPRFSWVNVCRSQGSAQNAYQIELYSNGKILWDSGKVDSCSSVLVRYGGPCLEYETDYSWRVRTWIGDTVSDWSNRAHFSTGLENNDSWNGAQWIGIDEHEKLLMDENHLAARYLRRSFYLTGKVQSAKLYICALGAGEVSINGRKASPDMFTHPPTLFHKAVMYRTYDVTELLHRGENCIGVILGSGRFQTLDVLTLRGVADPELKACLKIKYADGSDYCVVSDVSWTGTSSGPITMNNEFDGEHYDARLDLGKWDSPAYKGDGSWHNADIMEDWFEQLRPMTMDDMAVQDKVPAIAVLEPVSGRYIVDMGQNMVGCLSVSANGLKDKPVIMRFAEKLTPDGKSVDMSNLRRAQATDIYIPASDGKFSWTAKFPYHGYRYVEVTGLSAAPSPADFIGNVIYDKMEQTGSFHCSDPRLNQLYHNIFWGIRSNYRGMPIDCPQRDERQGWLGDRGATLWGEPYIFGVSNIYRKWMDDIYESMGRKGQISVVSPRNWCIYNNDTYASVVFLYIADMLYTRYGDDTGILTYYPAMKKWLNFITGKNLHDGIFTMKKDEYRDWCVPPEDLKLIHAKDTTRQTSSQVIQTAILCDALRYMIKFADYTGNAEDIPVYQQMLSDVKEAYNRTFYKPEEGCYDNNTVTANLVALAMDMVPVEHRQKVLRSIVSRTENDFDCHVSSGNVGMRYLMQTLTHEGFVDLAYKLATTDTYPSWGYMLRNGATTVWELWNGDAADPAMNSANHVMMIGDLLSWYYEDLAGIRNDPSDIAFRKIWMEPCFPSGLDSVDASYKSPYGLVESHWRKDGNNLEWDITVPCGSTATVVIPAYFNVDISSLPHHTRGNKIFIEISSGNYSLSYLKRQKD